MVHLSHKRSFIKQIFIAIDYRPLINVEFTEFNDLWQNHNRVLHSYKYMDRWDIYIGDSVWIYVAH